MTHGSPEEIVRYYSARLAAHGDTAEGAGWPNEPDRRTRFEVMAALAPGGLASSSLCDIACGTGAFLGYLEASGRAPAEYIGIDICRRAIDMAREKFPVRRFECADLLEGHAPEPAVETDWIVLNGLFTVRGDVSEADMWDFMTAMLARTWPMARRGLAFNVMSDVVDWHRDDLFHVPMDRLARFLFGLAGRRVVFRNDYDLYEYTSYVYRDGPAARS